MKEAILSKYSHGGRVEKGIDFSVNLNPLGLSDKIKKSILDNVNSILHYPDVSYKDIRQKLADYVKINPNNILVGNGSIEFIYLVPNALSIKKALIPVPTFSEYETAVKLAKGRILFIRTKETDGFKINLDEITKKLESVDILFLCNPNNPTGRLMQKQEIIFLAKKCEKKGVYLFIDETFIEFTEGENSAIREVNHIKNLLVLRSLTKFFSVPGIRIGYIAGNKNIINKIDKFQMPWSVNSIALKLAEDVLKDKQYIEASKNYIAKEKTRFFNELKKIKFIRPFEPSANFVLCKLNGITSKELFDKLLKNGFVIRNCSNFRGLNDKFVRFAIRTKADNDKLLRGLSLF